MRALQFFARAYLWQSLVVVLCLLLAVLMEGIGLSSVLPLLGMIDRAEAETEPQGGSATPTLGRGLALKQIRVEGGTAMLIDVPAQEVA